LEHPLFISPIHNCVRTVGICILKFITYFQITALVFALHATGQQNNIQKGKELFILHCSRCHGVQGGGGEGPALNRAYLPRASDDASFSGIIEYGIPGTGMAGNWMLGRKEISQVVAYVRSLSSIEKDLQFLKKQTALPVIP
jgi:mono/diheme cytochrome c family protein